LSLQPQMGLGYYYRGLAYLAINRTAEARADLVQAQVLLPEYGDEIGKLLQN